MIKHKLKHYRRLVLFFVLTIALILSGGYYIKSKKILKPNPPIMLYSSSIENRVNFNFIRGETYIVICDTPITLGTSFYCDNSLVKIPNEYKAENNIYFSAFINTPKSLVRNVFYNKDSSLIIIPKNKVILNNGLHPDLSPSYLSKIGTFVKLSYLQNNITEESNLYSIYIKQVLFLFLVIGLMITIEYEVKYRILGKESSGVLSNKTYLIIILVTSLALNILAILTFRDIKNLDLSYLLYYINHYSKLINVLAAYQHGNVTPIVTYISILTLFMLLFYISLLGLVNYKRISK